MAQPLTHDDPVQLGPYRPIARLGSGGMGTVYVGKSPSGRTVALKTMHARIAADDEFRIRFRLEIDAARVIGGRHGAEVIDADPVATTPWMATEYILGPSLDDSVKLHGVLPETCVRALGSALCVALERMHRSELVHRDLKPSNILITAFGPKIIDFGIARAIGDERLTRTGAAAGTPAFMSPEQATGREHSAHGDVFALAGVLLFAATGHAPFGAGQAADLLYRVRYESPDLSGVTGELRNILERSLAKDPMARPETSELGRALGGEWQHFADVLPDPVLSDIGVRCSSAFGQFPGRLAGPLVHGDETMSAPTGTPRRKVLGLTVGGAALAASVGAWWGVSRDDGNAQKSSQETSDRPSHVAPQAKWVYESAVVNLTRMVRAVGPAVVVATDLGLVGLSAGNGKELWVRQELSFSYPVTDGERLYVVRQKGHESLRIAELDIESGNYGAQVVETNEFDPWYTRLLAVSGDSVYLVSRRLDDTLDDGEGWFFLRFDTASGKEITRLPFKEGKRTSEVVDELVATLAGEKIILLWGDMVAAREMRTGREVWRKEIPKTEYDRSDPPKSGKLAVSNSHLYYGAGEVLAYQLSDGKVSWRFGEGRDMGKDFNVKNRRYGPPALHDDVVYVSEGYQGIVALDAVSGELLWEEKGTALPVEFDSPPVVGEKYVYGTVDGLRWIQAVDRQKHTSMWTYNGSEGSDVGRALFAHREAKRLVFASGRVVTAIPLE